MLTADFPPGAVGQARLSGRGPVAGYFQPVSISGPQGTRFALPLGNAIPASSESLTAGLLVGGVYRFQISGIPGAEGAELFPTIEVIDRTYPPPGLATPLSHRDLARSRGFQGGPQRPIGDEGDLPGGSRNGGPPSADPRNQSTS